MTALNLCGEKFGRLTVIERETASIERKYRQVKWICQCECGNVITVRTSTLRSGHTKSCGCLSSEKTSERNFRHGHAGRGHKSKLYTAYHNMIARCYNLNRPDNKFYTNISVCANWLESFENFRDWALSNGYVEGLTLDRIDVYGNYEPSNCRWTTWEVQHNNTRINRLIEYRGEVKSMKMWCKELGLPYYTIRSRIYNLNWDIEKAFETPIRRKGYNDCKERCTVA